MDEKRYPNPQLFDPSRFEGNHLTANESATHSDASQRDHFAFGAGCRLCPGIHVAERTLFLSISRLVWGFRIEAAKNDNGMTILPSVDDILEGVVICPRPFPAHIMPRSERHAQLIREAWHDCGELLDEQGQWRKVP